MRLSRDQFIEAAIAGQIADTSIDTFVSHVHVQSHRSQTLSMAFQALALIHAPVSAKLFNYFDCHGIGTKKFVRVDYSLECDVGGHQNFKLFVFFFLLCFTFALPLMMSYVLLAHCRTLRTPKTMQTYGFLYGGYRPGTEYWDIHELMRRLTLTGLMIFLPPASRLAACLLISITACCTLIGVVPHTSPTLQRLEQSAFVILTFKYVGGVLLIVQTSDNDVSFLGEIFLLLDVIYICHSFVCFVSIGYDVCKASMASSDGDGDGDEERTVERTKVLPLRSNGQQNQQRRVSAGLAPKKSYRTQTVEDIELTHTKNRIGHLKKIEEQQMKMRSSVQTRLEKRKRSKSSSS